MRRSFLSRLGGLVLATLMSLSAPGLALAHGHAHHEATEHAHHEAAERADDQREHPHGAGEATPLPADELIASVDGTGSTGDHGHPQLSLALSARADVGLFVLAAKVELPPYVVVKAQTSLLITAAPPRAGPPHAPPRQPRAPPPG